MQTSPWADLRADLRANPRDPKSWLILVSLRFCQFLIGNAERPPIHSWPAIAAYRLLTEFLLGVELRPTTRIGPGLAIYHGTGLVVNDHASLGSRVKLRNGVVIGNKTPNGPCPHIGDDVEIGAGAIIIGGIRIGDRAII